MSEQIAPKYELLVDGSPVDPVLTESIVVISVHKNLDMADMLEVKVDNDDLAWTQDDLLEEGKKIAVKLGYETGAFELVFTGEITRRDCVFPLRGPATVTVVAYDKKHHLLKGRESKTYLEMKDSDIVSAIAGEVGLSPDVDATETTHKWVFQQNQTHLAFLADRARRVGYSLKIDKENGKLLFKKPDPSSPATTLKWGENLLSFRPRMSTADQVSSVTVRSWDMVKKEKIEAKVEAGDIALALDGTKKGAALAPSAALLSPDTPLRDPGEAKPLATAIINQRANSFCEGSGSCQGDPLIDTGAVIEIDGVGKRAGGQYVVKEVLHHFEPAVGYFTRFQVIRASEQKKDAEREDLPEKVRERDDASGEKEHWVEIKARSGTGESLEGVSYTITLPNGEQKQGTFDETQTIRVEGVRDPGEVQVKISPPDDLKGLS